MSIELILLVIVVGVLVGLMSAMFGVGGGVIMVPFIVLMLDRSQHVAEGTSLLVIVPTAVAGVIAHHKRGYVDLQVAAKLAATGVFGAFLGARLALALPAERLEVAFGVFTMLVGTKLLLDGLRAGREERLPTLAIDPPLPGDSAEGGKERQ